MTSDSALVSVEDSSSGERVSNPLPEEVTGAELSSTHSGAPGAAAPVTTRRKKGELKREVLAAAADRSEGPCRVLPGYRRRACIVIYGKAMSVSRAVWIAANGDPGDLWVLHTCGNGQSNCIRLAHLYLGTVVDNHRDMLRDGNSTRGQRNAAALLTAADVLNIRRLLAERVPARVIAPQFGVSRAAVHDISSGRKWGWLT